MGGGDAIEDGVQELTISDYPSTDVSNILLVGKAGNGKSSTANSILGWEAFKSGLSLNGVTLTTQSVKAVVAGQLLNVIDSPGLFDSSLEPKYIVNEIANCVSHAEKGVHAVVAVFSVRTRFTKEEVAVLESLKTLFGEKFCDYLIVVFTGGDELPLNSFDEYLSASRSKHLTEIIQLCQNRVVLFDNKTNDEYTKQRQASRLVSFVKQINAENNGLPYSGGFLADLKDGTKKMDRITRELEMSGILSQEQLAELKEAVETSFDAKLHKILELLEIKVKEDKETDQKYIEEEQNRIHRDREKLKAGERKGREKLKVEERKVKEKLKVEERKVREKLKVEEQKMREKLSGRMWPFYW